MLSIFGLIHYPAIPRVCQSTNLPMSSKPRKSDSSSGNMKKPPNVRNYSTNSNTPDFHPFSRQVKDTPKCVQDRTNNPCTVLNLQWPQDPATTTQSPEGPLVGLAVIPKVEIQLQVGDTTMEIVAKEEEDMVVVGLIHRKDVEGHHMVLVVGPEEGLAVMELVLRIIHKVVVRMGVRVQVVGTGINNTVGSNK